MVLVRGAIPPGEFIGRIIGNVDGGHGRGEIGCDGILPQLCDPVSTLVIVVRQRFNRRPPSDFALTLILSQNARNAFQTFFAHGSKTS